MVMIRRELLLVVIAWLSCGALSATEPKGLEHVRFPRDLAVGPEDAWIVTANEQAGSLSLVDLASGQVVDELALTAGGRPRSVALREDADETAESRHLLAVCERFAHRVTFVRCDGHELVSVGSVEVGRLPTSARFVDAGRVLLVACAAPGEVWEIDVASRAVRRRIPAIEGCRSVELVVRENERGERREILALSGRSGVAVIDRHTGRPLIEDELAGGLAMNLGEIVVSGDRVFVSHQVATPNVEVEAEAVNWGLVISNRVAGWALDRPGLRFDDGSRPPRAKRSERPSDLEWVFPLDQRFRANGDPSSIAIVPIPEEDVVGRTGILRQGELAQNVLLITAAGTGRLLFIDLLETWPTPPEPLFTLHRVPELHLGGRPVAVRVANDGRRAFVASYLDDAIHEIDVLARTRTRTIRLSEKQAETAELAGARLFFDAKRSNGDWYSCQSCHPDGASEGFAFDTLSDDGGRSKKAPRLHGVADTGPWAWRAKFRELDEQVAASLHTTMAQSKKAKPEDVSNVTAYIKTLQRPARSAMSEAEHLVAKRGAAVFERANCAQCHRGDAFTSDGLKDVGLFDLYDGIREFNPPSLRGVRDDYRFLHDSRAKSLGDIFEKHNELARHGKADELTSVEIAELVAYLKSL